ncbi:hypothetical protein Tco_0190396 [Tanacetum coccineum]
MVAYLKKPEGSEELHQIVDFLNASHIRYALTANPTIYVSLIKQFWQTATAKTLDNGEIKLIAIIDGQVKTVTEASVRRHLQLSDDDGISSLPTTEIFEQLSLMGRITRQESVVPQPRSPTQTPIADEAASIGVEVRYGGAAIIKVESLETDLKKTKKLYGVAYTKLIKKVKKLEKTAKSSQARRRDGIVISDDEDDLEDPSKQGRNIAEIYQDPTISLKVSTAEKDVSTAKPVSTVGAAVTTTSVAVSTASPIRNTGVSTDDDITMAGALVYIRKSAAIDKGKAKMDEYEHVKTKTKLQQEQERLDFEVAVRLQAELEEEERQRIASVHEVASSFNVEEWEDIQARIEADEEAYQPEKEIKTFFETTMRNVKTFVSMESEDDIAVPELAAGISKRAAKEELDQESSKRQKTSESSELSKEPRDKEADELSQEELHQIMIIVPEHGMNVEALQTKYLIIDWEIYIKGTRIEGNRHLHAGREGVSIVKRKSYIDVGRKALGGSR